MSELAPTVSPQTGLDPILDELVDEFAQLLHAGASPGVEEFADRHPEHREKLLRILPAMQVLADLGRTAGDARPLNPQEGQSAQTAGTLGDFRILQEIGRGGMGVVYEAEQISLGRRVALKVLPFAATLDPKQIQRFKNEAQAAGQLHHTNIVPVHFVGCERAVHFYAMQYIDGQSLAQVIADSRLQIADAPKRAGPVAGVEVLQNPGASEYLSPGHATVGQDSNPVKARLASYPTADTPPNARLSTQLSTQSPHYFRTVAGLGIQAALALEYAHDFGVIHRDVKPGNLLMDYRGNLWVTDFGLAQIRGDNNLTLTGDLLGTLRYMSPEQALAKRVLVDHRTDIYSLGATLYELLTLEPVFTGNDRQELLRQIAFEEPKPLRRHNKSIPAELDTIVMKALEKNPAHRYATAKELAEDLERFVKNEPIRARRPSLKRRLGAWSRRHKLLVTGTVAIVLTALLLGGVSLWRRELQTAATVQAVDDDLKETELLLQGEQWAKALHALERAKGRLEGSGFDSLQARVAERKRDLAMVARLEEAQLKASANSPDGHVYGGDALDFPGADQAYRETFAEYGLDLTVLAKDELAGRIRASAIRNQLITALDHWASITERLPKGDGKPARAIAELADDDPWRQRLRDPKVAKNRIALESLAKDEKVLAQPPVNLLYLNDLLYKAKAGAAALQLLRRAQERYPADFWLNLQLASRLRKETALAEAVGFYRAALALQPQTTIAYNDMGLALLDQKKTREAEAAFKKAIQISPDFSRAYNNLGIALSDQHKLPEAIAAYRQAIQLQSNGAYTNLGAALRRQGKLSEAVEAYRTAIKLKSNLPESYLNLGLAMLRQRNLPEAAAAFRKLIELKATSVAYFCLGNVLCHDQNLPDAVAAYHKAIDLQPDFAAAHLELGLLLLWEGQFADALGYLKRGHDAGSPKPDWFYRVEQLGLLGAKLPKIMSGATMPADAAERIALAWSFESPSRQRYAASARLFSEAFSAEPKFANDLTTDYRYVAARAAAQAGCALGKDAGNLEPKEYSRLRGLALEWLRADLAARRSEMDTKPRLVVWQKFQGWDNDSDFDGVHFEDALAKLPEAERQDWRNFWLEFEELRQQAAGSEVEVEAATRKTKLDECREAELRERLAILARTQPDHWATFNTQALLGELFLGQKRYAEAEPLLLQAYEGLKKPQTNIHSPEKGGVLAVLAQLPRLYDAWGQKEKADRWRVELKAEQEAEQKKVERGFVREWLVLSEPVPYPPDERIKALDQDQIPGLALLRPRAGDKIEAGGKGLVWKVHRSPERHIDFVALYVAPTDFQVTYAVCYVNADADRSDLVLGVRSDAIAKVYINGREVYREAKFLRFVEDEVKPVALRKGSNVVVFKVVNGIQEWAGSLHFLDKDGRPVEGIRFGLAPE